MNIKISSIGIKFVAVVQILALTMLAACGAAGAAANVCHATGDAANPYQEITINTTALLNEHRQHVNDIFPVPVGGCPTSVVVANDGEIAICHATGSDTNPYEELNVSVNGLNGHGEHEGDIIPMPEAGCPATVAATTVAATTVAATDVAATGVAGTTEDATTVPVGGDPLTVCHATGDTTTPYEALAVDDIDSLNEHLTHPGDFSPVPVTGCPSYLLVISDGQTTICHASGDATTPYAAVIVSVNGLDGHGLHEGDVFPLSGQEGCPATLPSTTGSITICHATGSVKNPYVKITISINGLNGHKKHSGDIIPAPAAGCPATRP